MTEMLERPRVDHEKSSPAPFVAKILSEQEVRDVQRERTRYLKERGLIEEADLDEEGLIVDHYKERSVWMGVYGRQENELKLEAAGRLILPEDSLDTLQVKADAIIEPNVQALRHLKDIPLEQVAEVGSLIQLGEDPRANLSLYAGLRYISLNMGIKSWVCGLRQRNSSRFSKTFGPAIERLGKEVAIEGAHDTLIPYLLDLTDGVKRIREQVNKGGGEIFTRRTQTLFVEALDSLITTQ